MAVDDPYRILGVPRWASAEAIEKAYRREARRVHPDVNPSPDAAQEFYSVQRAYEMLRDPERRRAWDRRGVAAAAARRHGAGAAVRIEPRARRKAPPPAATWVTAIQGGLLAGNIAAMAFCIVQTVLVVQIRAELLARNSPAIQPAEVARGIDVVWDLSARFTPPPVSWEEARADAPRRNLPWLRTGLGEESDGPPSDF